MGEEGMLQNVQWMEGYTYSDGDALDEMGEFRWEKRWGDGDVCSVLCHMVIMV